MVWLPTAKAEVVKVAMPPIMVPLPTGLPPSRNVTVPVGVPAPGATGDTVAVKVVDWPNAEGLVDEATVVVVSALLTVRLAVAVLPVPAVVSLTVTLLLAVPTAVAVTFTVTVQ